MGIRALYLGDKLSNMRSLGRSWELYGNDLFLQFNQKNPVEHKWYYTAIAEALNSLQDTQAYREYISLIDKVFGGL